ncbi:MAG: class I SAM-dependent methyltransferase [Ktedonobacteraceae bacterium]|nr:class I SAM-dependent methyltransferase [Ktedonobacteraceae bacterium]
MLHSSELETPEEKARMAENLEQTRKSYDLMAEEYVSRLYHKLEHLPLDCELLERFAAAVRDKGLVCDIGCGPGQVARYLHERRVAVVGLDLSPRMVELARQLNPGITFQQGNMAKLKAQDASWAGIVAFYSIIHIPRSEVSAVLSEWWRVLQPGGLTLLSFHRGQQEQHVDTLWDKQLSLDFTFFECDEMEGYLREAGYVVEERRERGYYPRIEVETQRGYVLARKPT